MLTAQQAADEVKRSKPAILKAIKTGRLSAIKNGNGQWEIDPAELFRVYGTQEPSNQYSAREHTPKTERLTAEMELLKIRLEHTESQLSREKDVSTDLQKDRDYWRQQATALLTDQRPKPDKSGALDRFKIWFFGDKQANSNKAPDPRMTAAQ